jgi:hypothetical protein
MLKFLVGRDADVTDDGVVPETPQKVVVFKKDLVRERNLMKIRMRKHSGDHYLQRLKFQGMVDLQVFS